MQEEDVTEERGVGGQSGRAAGEVGSGEVDRN